MRHALACVVEGKIQIAPFAIKVTRVYIELNSMTVLSFDLLTLNFTIRLGTFLYAVCSPPSHHCNVSILHFSNIVQ